MLVYKQRFNANLIRTKPPDTITDLLQCIDIKIFSVINQIQCEFIDVGPKVSQDIINSAPVCDCHNTFARKRDLTRIFVDYLIE